MSPGHLDKGGAPVADRQRQAAPGVSSRRSIALTEKKPPCGAMAARGSFEIWCNDVPCEIDPPHRYCHIIASIRSMKRESSSPPGTPKAPPEVPPKARWCVFIDPRALRQATKATNFCRIAFARWVEGVQLAARSDLSPVGRSLSA